MVTKNNAITCDICGKFMSPDAPISTKFTPDSPFSEEKLETYHRDCLGSMGSTCLDMGSHYKKFQGRNIKYLKSIPDKVVRDFICGDLLCLQHYHVQGYVRANRVFGVPRQQSHVYKNDPIKVFMSCDMIVPGSYESGTIFYQVKPNHFLRVGYEIDITKQ